jgi:uroporphyrinogen decarboxylase
MAEMTSRERFQRMFEHREADRIPIIDTPWGATVERWRREGMPADAHYADFFGLDRVASIGADISPRYEQKVLEETDDYTITTTSWGVTLKRWKHAASTPEFLDYKITGPDTWRQAKARMTPTRDRVNWKHLEDHYPAWRRQGCWIQAGFWFGFDVTHSWTVGTERLLVAMIEDPEWVIDMWNHYLDMDLALFEMIRDAGYAFDAIKWPDDMGYKHHQFFSPAMYRDMLKPVHRRAVEWAHARGVKAHLHSCGDVNPFVPDLIDIGIDALHPLEVKAGMDPVQLKRTYGDELVLHGGINAVLWDDPEAIEAEMRRVIPTVKASGAYIFSSDHSVPSSVSLEDFRRIVSLAKALGAYGDGA